MKIGQRLWWASLVLSTLFVLMYWSNQNASTWTDELLLILSLGMVAFGHVLADRLIVSRLKELAMYVDSIMQGDASEEITVGGKDEIGIFADKFVELQSYLNDATNFVKSIGEGNLALQEEFARVHSDRLSQALLQMQTQMQELAEQERARGWVSNGLTKFNDLLRAYNDDLALLCRKIVSNLVSYLEVNQGGLFLVENKDRQPILKLVASYAYNREKFLQKEIEIGEGLVGQAYLEKSVIQIAEVPQSYINITSGLGKAVPKTILIVPIIINDEVYGIFEIASFQSIAEYKVEFIKRFSESFGSTISNVRNVEKTKRLLQEAQQQSEQLRSQEEEMRQNVEELAATQEEMARKQKELEKMNIKMQSNENVLRKALEKAKANEEALQEKNHLLQSQEEEMRQNMEELAATQEEMRRKQVELTAVNEQLKAQEEIMQLTVEQMKAAQEASKQKQLELETLNDQMQMRERILKKALEKAKKQEEELKEKNHQLQAQEEELRQNMEELAATQEELERKSKEQEQINEKLKANEQILKKAFEKMKEKEAQVKEQNEELRAQEEELRQNMEELAATQEEMERKQLELEMANDQMKVREKVLQKALQKSKEQKIEIQKKNEELRAQEEELRQNMEELAATQEELERKSKEQERINEKLKANEQILKKAFEKMKEKEAQIQEQNEELRAQEEELRQNMEELSATQEEMERKQLIQEQLNKKLEANEQILRKAFQKTKENEAQIKKQNDQLIAQEEELRQNMDALRATQEILARQKELVELKNRAMLESIQYAQIIQHAILPTPRQRRAIFEDSFVLFRPKDIVSGDFFWMYEDDDYRMAAVVDCTGHGVPGAFMSLVAHETLVELVRLKGMRDPAEILQQLDLRIVEKLSQDEEEALSNDGMDLSMCVFRKTENDTTHMTFSGAKTKLYVYTPNDFKELRGDRLSIGGKSHKVFKAFSNYEEQLPAGTMVYLFSDGIIDQANYQRKAFSSRRLKQILSEIKTLPIAEQEAELTQALDDYQGNTPQRDDITFMALKV